MSNSTQAIGVGAAAGLDQGLCTSREDVQGCKRKEMEFRKEILEEEHGDMIHHFNWEGKAVCTRSNTPPVHSLFIMMTQPRVVAKNASNELWHKIIMKCAMEYVDPVVIYSEGGDIPTHPEVLLNVAAKRTFKFYTRHGWWHKSKEEREGIIEDEEDVDFYMDKEVGVGNGFVECSAVKSRYQWYKQEEVRQWEADRERRRKRNLPTRIEDLHPPYRRSRLRICIAADEM